MIEPFFNLSVLSCELVEELHNQMIPQALSIHRRKVEGDINWKKAIASFYKDKARSSWIYVYTNYAPVDIPVGHNFSYIFQRNSKSNFFDISACVLHIIWHLLSIPVPVAGHGHRHFFVFDKKEFEKEIISNLPLLKQWGQIGNIDEDWCMI